MNGPRERHGEWWTKAGGSAAQCGPAGADTARGYSGASGASTCRGERYPDGGEASQTTTVAGHPGNTPGRHTEARRRGQNPEAGETAQRPPERYHRLNVIIDTSKCNYAAPESFRAIGPAPRIPGAGGDRYHSRRTLEVLPTIEGEDPSGRSFVGLLAGGVDALPHVRTGRKFSVVMVSEMEYAQLVFYLVLFSFLMNAVGAGFMLTKGVVPSGNSNG